MKRTIVVKVLMIIFILAALAIPVSAEGLQDSDVYTGTIKLVNDLSLAATVLCPLVGGVVAVVFVIRRSMADEQDGKMWTKRITTAIICAVAGMLITGIIALLTSYYV